MTHRIKGSSNSPFYDHEFAAQLPPRKKRNTLDLSDELLAAIKTKANRLGVSRAEVIRIILTDYFQGEMS